MCEGGGLGGGGGCVRAFMCVCLDDGSIDINLKYAHISGIKLLKHSEAPSNIMIDKIFSAIFVVIQGSKQRLAVLCLYNRFLVLVSATNVFVHLYQVFSSRAHDPKGCYRAPWIH